MDHLNYKPTIDVGKGGLASLTTQAWEAIRLANAATQFFVFQNKMCWFKRGTDGHPLIGEMTVHELVHLLARIATWIKTTKGGAVRSVDPPHRVAQDILATPSKPLPILRQLVTFPYFTLNGRLHLQPGYAPETQTYLDPFWQGTFPEVHQFPDQGQVAAALHCIDSLLHDFPLVDQSSRAHAYAVLLQPFLRDMISGPTPLYLISKPTPGTGGTLLAEVLSLPACGRGVHLITQPKDESELGRTMLAILRSGPAAVVIDNVDDVMGSPTMNSILTGERFMGRLIATSDMGMVDISSMFIATGNNPELSRETVRRVVPILLDARVERPEERRNFLHPNLKAWADEHRSHLVWSALTLIQYWISLGRPLGTETFGSYESYAEVMGGVLKAIGVSGFLGNRGALVELAQKDNVLRAFVDAWFEAHGTKSVSSVDLLPLAGELELGHQGDESRAQRLGVLLSKHKNGTFGEHRLVAGGAPKGSRRWQLVSAAKRGHISFGVFEDDDGNPFPV